MAKEEEEENKEEKKEEVKERFIVEEVPTEHTPMVVDTEKGEAYTIQAALAVIMNDLDKLKKLLD